MTGDFLDCRQTVQDVVPAGGRKTNRKASDNLWLNPRFSRYWRADVATGCCKIVGKTYSDRPSTDKAFASDALDLAGAAACFKWHFKIVHCASSSTVSTNSSLS